jgi:pimeloyl-ACP methyl ester carboxylesterase
MAIAAAFVGAIVAFVSAADARPLKIRETVDPRKCPQRAVCGTLMRPLDPSGEVAGKLPIVWRLYPHTGPTKLGVIVAQEGGPGYTSTGSAFSYLMLFKPLLDRYDLLLVDARGTGASAIECPSVDLHPIRTPDDVGKCGRQLGRASTLYGTRLAAEDMKAVLDELNITEINLYGDSYGTFFSQVFAALYPKMLRSLVLDATYPVIGQSPWYPENADVVKTGFNDACRRTPACAALGGQSLNRIRGLVNFIDAQPISGTAPDGEGVPRNVTADPGTIGLLLFSGAGPIIFRDLDAATRAFFDRGDKQPLLRMVAEVMAGFDPVKPEEFSYGLFAAVSCMDYQQIYDMQSPVSARPAQRREAIKARRQAHPDSFDPLSIAEFLTIPIDYSVIDLCLKWPVRHPPYPPGRPIPPNKPFTQAPTLILNGELDTLTAPGGGAIAASQFPNAQHVVVANSFHVNALYDTDGCASVIVRRFVETLNAGDTSCAQNVRPVRLVPFFPRRAKDATPAGPSFSSTARTQDLALASAAVQTAGDVIARWYINYTGTGAGLHGGRWSYTGSALVPRFTLKNVRWVEDLAVSGTAEWNGNTGAVIARLTYKNAKGETAKLTAQWNDRDTNAVAQLAGTVGDRTIRASMPAP